MLAARHRARLRMQDTIDDMQQEGIKLRNVRRRLFHDDDNNTKDQQKVDPGVEDNSMNFFYEEIRQKREEARRRWNFDFEKEEPLSGVYDWVKIDKDGNEVASHTEMQIGNKNHSNENMEHKELENEKGESRLTECDSDNIIISS